MIEKQLQVIIPFNEFLKSLIDCCHDCVHLPILDGMNGIIIQMYLKNIFLDLLLNLLQWKFFNQKIIQNSIWIKMNISNVLCAWYWRNFTRKCWWDKAHCLITSLLHVLCFCVPWAIVYLVFKLLKDLRDFCLFTSQVRIFCQT